MRITNKALVLSFVLLHAPATVHAQAPKGSDKLTPAAVAESLLVLEDLERAVREHPNDATIWYHRGMLAWALNERDKHKPSIPSLDRTRLGRVADTSLRIAAEIDKSNAGYRLMSGKYLLSSETSISRMASYGIFDQALETARKTGDPYTHSETAIEAGRVYWRRYDMNANRWMRMPSTGGTSDSLGGSVHCDAITAQLGAPEVHRLRDQMTECGFPLADDVSGEADYVRSEELFREAYDAQPSNQRAYRQLAMVLVEKNRWTELGALARARVDVAPWDAWAWLTLGLTLHERRADVRQTVAAFDSAFALLPYDEVQWFIGFQRVLRPKDTLKLASSDAVARFAFHRMFWTSANPLWSRDASQPQLDFLSRVVFAELRWTVEELNIRGADTDRGSVYIRYGKPDLKWSRRIGEAMGNPVATTWLYDRGLVFSFVGMPSFATARVPPDYMDLYGDIITNVPALWSEPPGFKLDSIPVHMARFRARGDSVDLFVASVPPVESIQAGAEVTGAVRADFWLLAGGTIVVTHDSVLPALPGIRAFTSRVRQRDYLYRLEASSDGTLHGARASGSIRAATDSATGFTMSGFGMSDILLAARATEGRDRPVRWSDLTIQPAAGFIAHGAPIALVWENYELPQNNGSAKYTVVIAMERVQQSTAGRIAAQIIGRVGTTIGVERADDRLTLTFDRDVAWAATLVDNVNITLGDTPSGTYKITVTITDKATQRITSRTTKLEILK